MPYVYGIDGFSWSAVSASAFTALGTDVLVFGLRLSYIAVFLLVALGVRVTWSIVQFVASKVVAS